MLLRRTPGQTVALGCRYRTAVRATQRHSSARTVSYAVPTCRTGAAHADRNVAAALDPHVPFLAVHAVPLPHAGAPRADRNRGESTPIPRPNPKYQF